MIRALAIAFLLSGCATTEANEQIEIKLWCDDARALAATLALDFNERPIAAGLTLNGYIMEIYASPNGKTFSQVVTHPLSNLSCVVYAGLGWKYKEPGI